MCLSSRQLDLATQKYLNVIVIDQICDIAEESTGGAPSRHKQKCLQTSPVIMPFL